MRKGKKLIPGGSKLVRVKDDMYSYLKYRAELKGKTIIGILDEVLEENCKQFQPETIRIRKFNRKPKSNHEFPPFPFSF